MSSVGRRLASGSVMRVVTLIARIGVGLFMVPFLIQGLGDRLYGLWALVGVVVGYYGMLDLGLAQALGRFVAHALADDDLEEANRLVTTGLVVYTLLGAVLMLGAGAVAALSPVIWSRPEDAALFAPLMLVVGLNLALGFPLRAFGGILQARLRHDLDSLFGLLTLILQTALIVWVVETRQGLVMIAWASLVGGLPEKALRVHFARRALPSLRLSRSAARRDTARQLLSFSFFLFVSRISMLLRFQTDAIVLTAFVGLVSVTHYRVGSTLIHYYRQLMIALFGALLPYFSLLGGRDDRRAREQTFFFSMRISVCISSFVAFGLIAWGEPFIVRWVGESYLDAYPVLVVLALGSMVQLWQSTFPTLLYSSGQERLAASLAIAEGVLNLVASLVLVPFLGMLGVAYGTLIPSVLVRLLIQPVLGCRAMEISPRRYVAQLLGTVVRATTCLLPGLLVTLAFARPDYLSLAGVAALSAATYALGLWFLEFGPGERQRLLRILQASPASAAGREA